MMTININHHRDRGWRSHVSDTQASQCLVFKQAAPPWLPFQSQSPAGPAGSPRPYGYCPPSTRGLVCFHSPGKVFASVDRAAPGQLPPLDQQHACLLLPLTQYSRDTLPPKTYPALQIHLWNYRGAWGPEQFLLRLGCWQPQRAPISELWLELGLQFELCRVAELQAKSGSADNQPPLVSASWPLGSSSAAPAAFALACEPGCPRRAALPELAHL